MAALILITKAVCPRLGAASEKYQSRTKTPPAWGSAEAANPTEGGYINILPLDAVCCYMYLNAR